MNVTCPKCGFEQPSDRFCANCGIDVSNYRVPTKPIGQRILASSLFYGLLALLLVGLAIFVMLRPEANLQGGFGSSNVAVGQRPLETLREAEPSHAPPTVEVPNTNGISPPVATPPVAPPLVVTPPTPAQAEAAVAEAAKKTKKYSLKVTWAEVNKDYFIELFGETLPYGTFRTGILMEEFNNRSLKVRMDIGRNEKFIRTLESGTYPINLGEGEKRIEIKQRSHDPKLNEKIGVVFNLDPVHIDEAGLQLRFEIRRALPTLQGQRYTLDTMNASDEILIPLRGAAFISGFLPHREPFDDTELKLFDSNSALKILNSKAFQSSQSEVVIFIEIVAGE